MKPLTAAVSVDAPAVDGSLLSSDFMAQMYQIQFRLGFRPRPRWRSLQRSPAHWGSLQRSPDLLAEFKGPTSKGKGGKVWGW